MVHVSSYCFKAIELLKDLQKEHPSVKAHYYGVIKRAKVTCWPGLVPAHRLWWLVSKGITGM